VNARAYIVDEVAGQVFVWYHADGSPPDYRLSLHRHFGDAIDAAVSESRRRRNFCCPGAVCWAPDCFTKSLSKHTSQAS
jgi:hypothetical protein